MTSVFTPREYQTQIRDFILDNPRCAIWAGMGMGKTTSTLNAICDLALTSSAPVLVLAPKRVAVSTWPGEVAKWGHLSGVGVCAIVGTAVQRTFLAGLDRQIYTTNYENLPWLVEHWGNRWPYETVIADEATRLKSFRLRQGGARAQALGKIAHTKIKRFIQLTGTPAPNGLVDLWGQLWFLDAGKRLGRTFSAFKDRWFTAAPNGFGVTARANAQTEIHAAIADLCLRVDAADWFDIAEPVSNTLTVQLPPAAAAHYKAMERSMFAEVQGHAVEAFGAAARTIKCLQMANGAVYVGDGNTEWAETHDAKLQALESIVSEANGMPVLVAYHFKSDLARLLKRFPEGKVLDANPKTIELWNKGQTPILFAHPASAGHGLNLQDGGNILVYFGHWWNLEERMQILERIGPTRQAQSGHKRAVFVYNIVADGTVDEDVILRTESKREVQDVLLASMKRKGYT